MNNIYSILNGFKSFSKEASNIFGVIDVKRPKVIADFDIGILTATQDEFEAIKAELSEIVEINTTFYDSTIYYGGLIKTAEKNYSVVIPFPIGMGIEPSVCSTTNILNRFSLNYLFMVGVCAGNKNVTQIGDIIIAEKSVNYNDVVEIEKEGTGARKKFMQNADSINKHLKTRFSIFSRSPIISYIKNTYQYNKLFPHELKCHIGLLVSGSSLLRSDEKIKEINESYHGVKGMDMETNGFYFTNSSFSTDKIIKFAAIKSVSDFGDNTKHTLSADERKKYALHTSSRALIEFIRAGL